MANQEQLERLQDAISSRHMQGRWNAWRAANPDIEIDLSNADLSGYDLRGADLHQANLSFTSLKEADLRDADLSEADLTHASALNADMRRADLRHTRIESCYYIGTTRTMNIKIDAQTALSMLEEVRKTYSIVE